MCQYIFRTGCYCGNIGLGRKAWPDGSIALGHEGERNRRVLKELTNQEELIDFDAHNFDLVRKFIRPHRILKLILDIASRLTRPKIRLHILRDWLRTYYLVKKDWLNGWPPSR